MKTKNLPLFRSLIGVALLLASAFVLWAAISPQTQGAISFGMLFTVDSTGDHGDVAPGNGVCDIGNGHCTLRAALQEVIARNNGGDGIIFDIPTSDPNYNAQTGTWTLFTGFLPDPERWCSHHWPRQHHADHRWGRRA